MPTSEKPYHHPSLWSHSWASRKFILLENGSPSSCSDCQARPPTKGHASTLPAGRHWPSNPHANWSRPRTPYLTISTALQNGEVNMNHEKPGSKKVGHQHKNLKHVVFNLGRCQQRGSPVRGVWASCHVLWHEKLVAVATWTTWTKGSIASFAFGEKWVPGSGRRAVWPSLAHCTIHHQHEVRHVEKHSCAKTPKLQSHPQSTKKTWVSKLWGRWSWFLPGGRRNMTSATHSAMKLSRQIGHPHLDPICGFLAPLHQLNPKAKHTQPTIFMTHQVHPSAPAWDSSAWDSVPATAKERMA